MHEKLKIFCFISFCFYTIDYRQKMSTMYVLVSSIFVTHENM